MITMYLYVHCYTTQLGAKQRTVGSQWFGQDRVPLRGTLLGLAGQPGGLVLLAGELSATSSPVSLQVQPGGSRAGYTRWRSPPQLQELAGL